MREEPDADSDGILEFLLRGVGLQQVGVLDRDHNRRRAVPGEHGGQKSQRDAPVERHRIR